MVSPVSGVYDLADADLRVMGNDTYDWAGDRVAMGGDLDGDGLSDLVISAPSEGDEEGSISVFSGASRGSARMSDGVTRLYGRRGSFLGAALSWQGDRDQDGTTDLLIAAPYINEAWLLPGPTAGSGYLDELAPVHLIGDGVDYGGSGDPSGFRLGS